MATRTANVGRRRRTRRSSATTNIMGRSTSRRRRVSATSRVRTSPGRRTSTRRATKAGGGRVNRRIVRTANSRTNVRTVQRANGNTVRRKVVRRKTASGKVIRRVVRTVTNRQGKVIGRFTRTKRGGKVTSTTRRRMNVGQRRRPVGSISAVGGNRLADTPSKPRTAPHFGGRSGGKRPRKRRR